MEAASVPATPAAPGQAVRDFISKYGLIVVLLAMPVWFAIQDLTSDTENLSRLGNNLVDGISNGAIWALVAIGYTLVYGIVELINFAHGEVFMIGSFVAAGLFTSFGLTQDTGTGLLVIGLVISLPLTMLASGMLNTMIERVAYRPLQIRAQARSADHGRRLLVHPAERRPALARRLAAGHPGPDPLAARALRHRRRRRSPTATCSPCA